MILEAVICGETEISSDRYSEDVHKLKERDYKSGKSGFECQFELLSKLSPNPDDINQDTAQSHMKKNRSQKYLPCKFNYY